MAKKDFKQSDKKLEKDLEKDTPIPVRLKYLRGELSQRKLGIAALNFEPLSAGSRMSQYENGVYVPGFHLVKGLAKYFGYPPSFFYEPDDTLAKLLEVAKDLKKPQLDAFIELMQFAKEKDFSKNTIRSFTEEKTRPSVPSVKKPKN